MFRNDHCGIPGCLNSAFAGTGLCFAHQDDQAAAVESALLNIKDGKSAKNLTLSGIALSDRDFSRKKFVGCSFAGATMSHVMFTGAIFRLCIFDRAVISGCDFSGVDMDFCSFGDAEILDSSFENSELIHVNFDGSRLTESTFSGSNLYDSRFLLCTIANSSFDDCDFKRAYFIPSSAEGLTMKNSNTMEAVREFGQLYR